MRENALILLVEARADYVIIILRSFDKAGIKNGSIQVLSDAREAIAYLSGQSSSNR